MKKISSLDRLLLLAAALLAAYQVVIGVDGSSSLAMTCYTIAFGVLLVAELLMIILGFEVLDSPLVAIVSTAVPLSLSLGLVADYLPGLTPYYLAFTILGFLAVVVTRYATPGPAATIVLALVHGIAGLVIFILPIVLSVTGETLPGFALVGLGGALIGVGGLLLSFLKMGKPILSKETILTIFPGLLLVTTAVFVAGFKLG